MRTDILSIATLLLAASAAAQSVAIVSTNHDVLPLLRTAPGQLTSFRLTGIPPLGQALIRSPQPSSEALAGISILLGRPGLADLPLRPIPILAVEQIPECQGEAMPDCLSTVVTAQVPYDFPADDVGPNVISLPRPALAVRYRGVTGSVFRVAVQRDNVHFLQECDLIGERQRPCQALIRDGEGRRIRSWGRPDASRVRLPVSREGRNGVPGETIVLYAHGLGRIQPLIQAGTISPLELIRVEARIIVEFEYLTESGWMPAENRAEPQFAGLAPGSIGLYQVNVSIPPTPIGLRRCFSSVAYNTIIRLHGALTSDEAFVCVEP